MNELLTAERKKPGRKSETPAQRLARLEKDIVAARQAVAQAETKRLATIGSAVMAEAESNQGFRQQLQKLLQSRITTKAGQAEIAELINSLQNEPAAPAP